jgi:hypothetical protein
MTKSALVVQITGEAYRRLLDWRNEIDRQLIQFQLEHNSVSMTRCMSDCLPGAGHQHD